LWTLTDQLSHNSLVFRFYFHFFAHFFVHFLLDVLVGGVGLDEGVVKIADFGLARLFREPVQPLHDNGTVVTIWYRAPELLMGAKHYTRAIDMWAIGCIFAELMCLRAIFRGEENLAGTFQKEQILQIFAVLGKPGPDDWPDVADMPYWPHVRALPAAPHNQLVEYIQGQPYHYQLLGSEGFDLLQRLLCYDPARRITARDALAHPYFAQAPLPTRNSFVHSRDLPFPSEKQQEEHKQQHKQQQQQQQHQRRYRQQQQQHYRQAGSSSRMPPPHSVSAPSLHANAGRLALDTSAYVSTAALASASNAASSSTSLSTDVAAQHQRQHQQRQQQRRSYHRPANQPPPSSSSRGQRRRGR
jgi:cyclin-dependent kinase 8/11